MNLLKLFKRVSELTAKYPNLNKEETKELMRLSRQVSTECGDVLYDWTNN